MSRQLNSRQNALYAVGALTLTVGSLIYSASITPDLNLTQRIVREPARGAFLVADAKLRDANFSHSVVLLTDHGASGSVGLIINKRTSVAITSMVPRLRTLESPETNIFFGGPVSLQSVRILVSSSNDVESSERIVPEVYFVNSIEVLLALLKNGGSTSEHPIKYFAGYAAWSPGQLESEIAQGDWHLASASETTVFSKDVDGIWPKLIEQLEGTWVLLDNASSNGGN